MELKDIAIIRGIRFLFCDMQKWIMQGCQNQRDTPILYWGSHWRLSWCIHYVHHICQDKHKKNLGSYSDYPHYDWWLKMDFGHQFCGNQKFSVTKPTMIKFFLSPFFRCVIILALPFTWKNILKQKTFMEIPIFHHAKI